MGLCTGIFLARAGKDVTIVEAGEPWAEASGVNAGSLGVQNKRLPLVRFTLASLDLWRSAGELFEGDVGFVPSGGLRVATSREDAARLAASAAEQREVGLATEWLEGGALRARAPWLGPAVAAATFSGADSFGIPRVAGPVLMAAFRRAGGRLFGRTRVTDIAGDARGARVAARDRTMRCGKLVIAAGAWSGELASCLGVRLPVGLEVNMLTLTEAGPPIMDRLVTHVQDNLTLKQYPDGTCMIGGGWQGVGSLASGRKDLDRDRLARNLRLAYAVVPGLERLRVARSWAGFEGAMPDALPIFGRLPGQEHVYITACCPGGFTQGLIFGRLMAELVATGETSMAVGSLDPRRFVD
jgi:glycine/D-amino acid oxidase-like deaminating enzyme